MNEEIDYTNNPLHGVSLKTLLNEVVDHYGFEILFAYLSINCFKNNPSVLSSMKFLKKTDWAREKVESFYLYQFKNLPRASSEQFVLSPRDRIIPEDQSPGEPKELNLEEAKQILEKRAKNSTGRSQGERPQPGNKYGAKQGKYSNDRSRNRSKGKDPESSTSTKAPDEDVVDPWANWKNKSKQ